MNSTIQCIDPVVRKVAEAYNFTFIKYEATGVEAIKGDEMACSFFWTSTQTTAEFFAALRLYFIEIGGEYSTYGCGNRI